MHGGNSSNPSLDARCSLTLTLRLCHKQAQPLDTAMQPLRECLSSHDRDRQVDMDRSPHGYSPHTRALCLSTGRCSLVHWSVRLEFRDKTAMLHSIFPFASSQWLSGNNYHMKDSFGFDFCFNKINLHEVLFRNIWVSDVHVSFTQTAEKVCWRGLVVVYLLKCMAYFVQGCESESRSPPAGVWFRHGEVACRGLSPSKASHPSQFF